MVKKYSQNTIYSFVMIFMQEIQLQPTGVLLSSRYIIISHLSNITFFHLSNDLFSSESHTFLRVCSLPSESFKSVTFHNPSPYHNEACYITMKLVNSNSGKRIFTMPANGHA